MEDQAERRQHRRYKASADVFAVLGSDAEIMGRIQEMGEGGLSFIYRDNKRKAVPVSTIQPLSILSDGYYTTKKEPSKFQVKVIFDSQTEENTIFNSSTVRRIGVQFNDLTFYQKVWLGECMKKYTLDKDKTDSFSLK